MKEEISDSSQSNFEKLISLPIMKNEIYEELKYVVTLAKKAFINLS
jgi:hypothetical protein